MYGQIIQAISVLLRQGTSLSDGYIKFLYSVMVTPSTADRSKTNVRISGRINIHDQCSRSPITLTLHTPNNWSDHTALTINTTILQNVRNYSLDDTATNGRKVESSGRGFFLQDITPVWTASVV